MSLPGYHDFELYQGDSDKLSYTFLEDNAARTPVDLTGAAVTLTAKHAFRDDAAVLKLEAMIPTPATGDFYFEIQSDLTKRLGQLDRPMELVYDMAYRHGDTHITIVRGRLTILPEVG